MVDALHGANEETLLSARCSPIYGFWEGEYLTSFSMGKCVVAPWSMKNAAMLSNSRTFNSIPVDTERTPMLNAKVAVLMAGAVLAVSLWSDRYD